MRISLVSAKGSIWGLGRLGLRVLHFWMQHYGKVRSCEMPLQLDKILRITARQSTKVQSKRRKITILNPKLETQKAK